MADTTDPTADPVVTPAADKPKRMAGKPSKRKLRLKKEGDPKPGRVTRYSDPITVPVVNRVGEKVGEVTVDPADYGGKISKTLLHEAVLMYRARQRAGTHSTLRRGEVAGSTKKIFRQKGTGNARAGTKRTNKRVGGGTAKGPKPRDYSYSMPKKAVKAAVRMAILSKFLDNEAVVIDELALPAPKTKEVVAVLKAIKVTKKAAKPAAGTEPADDAPPAEPVTVSLAEQTVLIGTAGLDQAVYRSARNIEGVKVLPAGEFNVYSVLRHKRLLITRAAFDFLKDPDAARAAQVAAAPPVEEKAPLVRRGRAGRIQKRKATEKAAATS